MKVSNLADVGQMRSRSGISMKIMRNELALDDVNQMYLEDNRDNLQTQCTEEDHNANVEEMRDS
jgi:hypothetical protein